MSEPRTRWNKPGHFISADKCDFGRTTVVKGFMISSVGEYRPNGKGTPLCALGYQRLYETYVFRWRGKRCRIKNCACGGFPVPTSWEQVDGLPAMTRDECKANHRKMVKKYGAKK